MSATSRTPGWYPNPDDPDTLRWWNGLNFDGEPRPIAGFATPVEIQPAPSEIHTPIEEPATPPSSLDGIQIGINYVLGAIVPIYGIVAALVIGVNKKYADIRRHAIGIAVIALIAAGIYVVIFTAGSSTRSDNAVQSDFTNLMLSNGQSVSNVTCAHEGGNEYTCLYDTASGTGDAAQVTDDGHSISEIP